MKQLTIFYAKVSSYTLVFLVGAFILCSSLSSCGTTRYRTTYGYNHSISGVNRVSNVHICPSY
jgi:hypothetical protein